MVPPAPLTYLSIWPTGQSQPVVSTLNSFDGRVVANAAIVPAGSGGAISLYASDATHVILDINGYFVPATTAGSLSFYSATPCRIVDTRNANGAFGSPYLNANSTRNFVIPASSCGTPSSAQAYSLNITVVPHEPLTYLTVWPAGQTQPVVSTLNSYGGSIVANAAIVPAGLGGAVSVFVTGDTDLIIDINGYFAPAGSASALSLYTLTPCRVADTRSGQGFTGQFGPPSMPANQTRELHHPHQRLQCAFHGAGVRVQRNGSAAGVAPVSHGMAGGADPAGGFHLELAHRTSVGQRGHCTGRDLGCGQHLRLRCHQRDSGYQRLFCAMK